ncbi:JmjC domain-containing protein 5 [Xylariales sp. AK1849]|nr:JmjC domain-containing protein 5 [Xylariales sp. AK1849]
MRDPRDVLFSFSAEAAVQIKCDCESVLSGNDDAHELGLSGCDQALLSLLAGQALGVCNAFDKLRFERVAEHPQAEEQDSISKRLDDILSIAYSKFYAFLFKDLPICWRQLYTDASILKFCFLLSQRCLVQGAQARSRAAFEDGALTELVKTLDLALILAGGAGEKRGRKWIDKAFELLDERWTASSATVNDSSSHTDTKRPTKRPRRDKEADEASCSITRDADLSFSPSQPFTPLVKHPVRRIPVMSMESFQEYMGNTADSKSGSQPIVLTGMIEEWPARTTNPWDKPAYLLSRTFDGRRLVPVEIGRSYVDEGWGQKIITFGEFLRGYIDRSLTSHDGLPEDHDSSNQAMAYLAQHPLFTQLPILRNDILIPDLCYTSPPAHPIDPSIDQPELAEPLLNAWFGPPGTITPLHNDPYHNLLVQVVGRKYVRLYSPMETKRMYARGKENGVEMGNTSMLDIGVMEGWDHINQEQDADASAKEVVEQMKKEFKDVLFVDCILGPGDTLYIPIGWWHYVRGLSVSFSVSFWWN